MQARGAGSRRRRRLRAWAGAAASCSGIVWLHLDAEQERAHRRRRRAVASPGSRRRTGSRRCAAIADSAGPSAAAAALSGALGVSMDAWVALDRKATELAVQAMFPLSDVRAARTRYREARAAWRGRGGATRSWATQYETPARRPAPGALRGARRGRVLQLRPRVRVREQRPTLQGATSLGEALRTSTAARSRCAPRRSSWSAAAAGRSGAPTPAGSSRCASPSPSGSGRPRPDRLVTRAPRATRACSSSRRCRAPRRGPLRRRGARAPGRARPAPRSR